MTIHENYGLCADRLACVAGDELAEVVRLASRRRLLVLIGKVLPVKRLEKLFPRDLIHVLLVGAGKVDIQDASRIAGHRVLDRGGEATTLLDPSPDFLVVR